MSSARRPLLPCLHSPSILRCLENEENKPFSQPCALRSSPIPPHTPPDRSPHPHRKPAPPSPPRPSPPPPASAPSRTPAPSPPSSKCHRSAAPRARSTFPPHIKRSRQIPSAAGPPGKLKLVRRALAPDQRPMGRLHLPPRPNCLQVVSAQRIRQQPSLVIPAALRSAAPNRGTATTSSFPRLTLQTPAPPPPAVPPSSSRPAPVTCSYFSRWTISRKLILVAPIGHRPLKLRRCQAGRQDTPSRETAGLPYPARH